MGTEVAAFPESQRRGGEDAVVGEVGGVHQRAPGRPGALADPLERRLAAEEEGLPAPRVELAQEDADTAGAARGRGDASGEERHQQQPERQEDGGRPRPRPAGQREAQRDRDVDERRPVDRGERR